MKVLGVKGLYDEKIGGLSFLSRLNDSLSEASEEFGNVDLVVGTDHALDCYDSQGNLDLSARNDVLGELKGISGKFKKTMILPGTSFRRMGNNYLALSCPVFKKGRKITELNKEGYRNEIETIKELGFEHYSGKCNENVVYSNGKIIPVEICSDHGHQKIPKDTYLEVIMANDIFAGFSPRHNEDISRYFLVNDHQSAGILCGHYKSGEGVNGIKEFAPLLKTKNYEVFELDD